MAFQISPSVNVQETDLTLNVNTVANYIGATAGYAQWGPANKPTLLTNGEDELVSTFFKPNSYTYLDFFTLSDFFSYSPKAWFTRVVGPDAKNAVDNGGASPVLVRNDDEQLAGVTANSYAGTQFITRYPGSLGNGIVVDIADSTKFSTWEFKSSFNYAPQAGEYAIAVVDSTGVFSNGVGESKQQERLSLYGSSISGGVKEVRTMTLSGTVTGGTSQVETLTFSGTSTGTSITVDGVVVTIANADTASAVATKVATALAAVPATYTSAVAVGPVVTVTYKVPALRSAIATGTAVGMSWSSVIATSGDPTSNITLLGRTFQVTYGDTAATVAGLLVTQLGFLGNVYDQVSNIGAVVTYRYASYGASSDATTSQVSDGITGAIAVTTPGNSNVNLSIFGTTVAVLNNDTPSAAAVKIAVALTGYAPFTALYDSITASGASVTYRAVTVGSKAVQTTPADQGGISFAVSAYIAGKLGSILEKYEIVTSNSTDKYPDGTTRYFVDSIQRKSKYVFVGDKSIALSNRSTKLLGGVDDYSLNRVGALSLYANAEQMDINYIFTAGNLIEQKAVADVVEQRKDCVAFYSPMITDVVSNAGDEMAAVIAWRTVALNRESSYGFNTDNWGLIYDKYNDTNRWIPTCGGTAGLLARTSQNIDPWISPAGTQRGRYLRYIRTAWSANKAQRDEMYKVGVNSVVTFPADGIVLYGDKTSTTRPSAFDRINVRQAFIVAEKSIANFSKQFLFEINDEFTRAQFLNAVRPFLRGMVSRRAFSDFKVIADETNNTAQVVSSNAFAGTILLKPAYSINFINLNFVATRQDVSFDEVAQFV